MVCQEPFINFSPSPKYLLVTLLAVMLKKAKPDSVATALANKVLPVPGGPNNKTPAKKGLDKDRQIRESWRCEEAGEVVHL